MTFRLAVTLVACLALSACGDDAITSATPPVDVAGTWHVEMGLHVVRLADGYRAQRWCSGVATLTQEPGVLRGTLRSTCEGSSELSGSVNAAGKVVFTMDGFKPAGSACPGAKDVGFAGEFWLVIDGKTQRIRAAGATRVSCGDLGDHDYAYTFEGQRGW